jgi:surface antigen
MLPALPGTTLAKPYTPMAQRPITLVVSPGDSYDTLSGTVTLAAGTSYSWTEGIFLTVDSDPTRTWATYEPIVASTIKPQGGTYNWTCWLDGDSATSTYASGCSIRRSDLHEFYSMDIGTFGGRASTYNWQVSFVPTSRTPGTVRDTNTFPAGQCTWGAEDKFQWHFGVYPNIVGNAKDWYARAYDDGWAVTNQPQSDSVVVFQSLQDGASKLGHVGWVEGVEYRSDVPFIHTTELNIAKPGEANRYLHRILNASALQPRAGSTIPDRGYILGIWSNRRP